MNQNINKIWTLSDSKFKFNYDDTDESSIDIFNRFIDNYNKFTHQINYGNNGKTGIMLDVDLKFKSDDIIFNTLYTNKQIDENEFIDCYTVTEDVSNCIKEFSELYAKTIINLLYERCICSDYNKKFNILIFLRDFSTISNNDDNNHYYKYGSHIYINNLFASYSSKLSIKNWIDNTLYNYFNDKIDIDKDSNKLNKSLYNMKKCFTEKIKRYGPQHIENIIDCSPLLDSASYPFTYNKIAMKIYSKIFYIYVCSYNKDKTINIDDISDITISDYVKKYSSLIYNNEKINKYINNDIYNIPLRKNLLIYRDIAFSIISPFATSSSVCFTTENNIPYKLGNINTQKKTISFDNINNTNSVNNTDNDYINNCMQELSNVLTETDKLYLLYAKNDIADHDDRMNLYRAIILKFIAFSFNDKLFEDYNMVLDYSIKLAYLFRNSPNLYENIDLSSSKKIKEITNNITYLCKDILNKCLNIKSSDNKINISSKEIYKEYYNKYILTIKKLFTKYNTDENLIKEYMTDIQIFIYETYTNYNTAYTYCDRSSAVSLLPIIISKFCFKNVIGFPDKENYYVFNKSSEDILKWEEQSIDSIKSLLVPFREKLLLDITMFKKNMLNIIVFYVYNEKENKKEIYNTSYVEYVLQKLIEEINSNSYLNNNNLKNLKYYINTAEFSYNNRDNYNDTKGVYNGLLRYDSSINEFILIDSEEECRKRFITMSTFAKFNKDIYNKYNTYKEYIDDNKLARNIYNIICDIIVPDNITEEKEKNELFLFRVYLILNNMFDFNPQLLKLIISYGTGSDGKTTLSVIISTIIGGLSSPPNPSIEQKRLYSKQNKKGYAISLKSSILQYAPRSAESHNSGSIIEADKKTYIILTEPDQSKPFVESIAKQLACGTQISGRKCGSPDTIDMINTANTEVQTNYLSKFDNISAGLIRRCLLIIFPNKFTTNKELINKKKPGLKLADENLDSKIKDPEFADTGFMLFCFAYRDIKRYMKSMNKTFEEIIPKIYLEQTECYFNQSDVTFNFRKSYVIYNEIDYNGFFIPISIIADRLNNYISDSMQLKHSTLLEIFDRNYVGCVYSYDSKNRVFTEIPSNEINSETSSKDSDMFVNYIFLLDSQKNSKAAVLIQNIKKYFFKTYNYNITEVKGVSKLFYEVEEEKNNNVNNVNNVNNNNNILSEEEELN